MTDEKTIESQLDELIVQGTATNDLLTQILEKMDGGGDPCPPDPEPPDPEPPNPQPGEVLIFKHDVWAASDIGLEAGKLWRPIDRPHEQTLISNLTFAGGKVQFNKSKDRQQDMVVLVSRETSQAFLLIFKEFV
jgi:hypothetical protein